MSSDIEERDHAFDAPPSPSSGADRQQDLPPSPSTGTSPPFSDSSEQPVTVGDITPQTADQGATDAVPHFKVHDTQGHEFEVSGDPEGCRHFAHHQGENSLHFEGTCGLCSVQDIANQYGLPITEDEMVQFAAAHHLCETHGAAEDCGGTTLETQTQLLADMGIMAMPHKSMSVEELASTFEKGHKVIIEVNAGVLFQGVLPEDVCARAVGSNPSEANHAIVVTGIVRDPQTGEVVGIYINDTGAPLPAQFISVDHLQQGWVNAGGTAVEAIGTVGGRPAAMPEALPGTDPSGDVRPDSAVTPESQSGLMAAAVALPLLGLGALRIRPRPKPKN